jgi:hypothetical protein
MPELTVTILPADPEPMVKVTGTVTVRGVEYEVNVDYRWTETSRAVYDRSGFQTDQRTYWEDAGGAHWGRYRRDDNGHLVKFRSPTYWVLRYEVSRALSKLMASAPEWQRDSHRLRLDKAIGHRESQARELRRQAEILETEAEQLRRELERG